MATGIKFEKKNLKIERYHERLGYRVIVILR